MALKFAALLYLSCTVEWGHAIQVDVLIKESALNEVVVYFISNPRDNYCKWIVECMVYYLGTEIQNH